jgi:hypothetical protein
MARTHSTLCPDCETLREIPPTDIPVGRLGRAKRWRIVMHPGSGPNGLCDGGGKLV